MDDDKIRRALESDLIRDGLRLRWVGDGEHDFTWSDLLAYFVESGEESALFRAMYPDKAGWTLQNMLLADVVDLMRIQVWQRTKNGRKGRMAPDPIPRPGVEGPKRRRVKGEAVPMDQFKDKLASLRRRVMGSSAEESKRVVKVEKKNGSR